MRYFIQFNPNTTLADSVMVLSDITETQARDNAYREYGLAVRRIYTEPEFASLMPQIYSNENTWVPYGTVCIYTELNVDGSPRRDFYYPISKHYQKAGTVTQEMVIKGLKSLSNEELEETLTYLQANENLGLLTRFIKEKLGYDE